MGRVYKTIPLSRGRVDVVDPEDYERLSRWKWCFSGRYAVRFVQIGHGTRGRRRKVIFMHRVVLGVEPGQFIDHRNGDGLDSRRDNLRLCTKPQNMMNCRPKMGATSRFKGVSWDAVRGRWRATIRPNGRAKLLGRFSSEEAAARVYDAAARAHFGEFARLNFPEAPANG